MVLTVTDTIILPVLVIVITETVIIAETTADGVEGSFVAIG